MNPKQGLKTFRRFIGETRHQDVVPDDLLYDYLTGGLEAFQDLAEYHYTDDSSGITLVASTQEYTLPTDCTEVLWVQHNGTFLELTDEEQLQQDHRNWREAKADFPKFYYLVGRKIGFFPKPNGLAVAAAANPVIRYLSTPASFRLSGFAQMATQHHRIPIYHAAGEWELTKNGNTVKAKGLFEQFERRATAAAAYYRDRNLKRG